MADKAKVKAPVKVDDSGRETEYMAGVVRQK